MRSIEVDNVAKRYRLGDQWRPTLREGLSLAALRGRSGRAEREFWALRGVGFAVEQGEVAWVMERLGEGRLIYAGKPA